VRAIFLVALCLSATLAAAPQSLPQDLPVSLDRVREELAKAPPKLRDTKVPVPTPVARFRTTVEQRRFVGTFEEWLDKEFKLTALQRQSAEWGAKCCGISLDPLFKGIERALERRQVRKIREQIARELEQIETARKEAERDARPPKD
jgi:hypothetical protein